MEKGYIKDWVEAGLVKIPRVSAELKFNDHWNNILMVTP